MTMLDEDGTTRMSLNDGGQMDMYDVGNPRLSLGTNISDDRPDSPFSKCTTAVAPHAMA